MPAGQARRDRARAPRRPAAELGGEVGGDERAGPLGGLDDHGRGGSAAMRRLRAEEAPADGGEARRQLGDDAARAAAIRAVQARGAGRVRRGRRRRASTATVAARPALRARRRGRRSRRRAPCRRRPARRRRRAPRPSARATSMPYGVAAARADDRDAVAGVRAPRSARDVEHRGRVGELAQAARDSAASQRQTAAEPGAAIAVARATRRRSARSVARDAARRRRARAARRRAARARPRAPPAAATRTSSCAGERRDQGGPAQAARSQASLMRRGASAWSSSRSAAAWWTWSGCDAVGARRGRRACARRAGRGRGRARRGGCGRSSSWSSASASGVAPRELAQQRGRSSARCR